MKNLITLLFASSALVTSFLATSVTANEHAHGGVVIEHPWSRPTPPGTPMGVGYLVIRNHSDRDITLISASTPRADHVSIHETLMKDGVMRMEPLDDGLAISAGEAVELKPLSYHFMLEKLTAPLKEGEGEFNRSTQIYFVASPQVSGSRVFSSVVHSASLQIHLTASGNSPINRSSSGSTGATDDWCSRCCLFARGSAGHRNKPACRSQA